MNRKQITLAAAIAVLIGSWLYIVMTATGGGGEPGVWFYDLDAGELYAAPRGTVAPTTAPSGGEGVKAMVYACDSCDGETAVGYLVNHQPALKRKLEAGEEVDPQMMLTDQLIRAAAGDAWHPAGSPEARDIKAAVRNACGDQRVAACQP